VAAIYLGNPISRAVTELLCFTISAGRHFYVVVGRSR
jgi:hypothetical protein